MSEDKQDASPKVGNVTMNKTDMKFTELDWIDLQREIIGSADTFRSTDGKADKFVNKIKENPFVPIGCLLTATVLSIGLWNFRQGRSRASQLMMRFRIAAQGFTIFALLGGIVLAARK